jgi:hypothetical protein
LRGGGIGMIGKALAGALIAGVLWLNSVPTTLTGEDKAALSQALAGRHFPISTFDQQVASIVAIQGLTAAIATGADAIPLSVSREPADFLRWRRGACYDRSRFIEKALSFIGLETRHVAVYQTDGESPFGALVYPETQSHALTEVKTSRGWMLVDSLSQWIGLTADGRVVSADMLERDTGLFQSQWDSRVKDPPNWILSHNFVDVVGLYSRHGDFYWPYEPMPDVNWTQLVRWLLGA